MSIQTFIVPTGPGTLQSGGSNVTVSDTGGAKFLTAYGALALNGTEAQVQCVIPSPGALKVASINIISNADTGGVTYTLRKNGVNTSIVITVSAGTTGIVSDTSNSVVVAQGDLIDWAVSQATTGNIVASSISVGYVTSNTVTIPSKTMFFTTGGATTIFALNSTAGARFIPVGAPVTAGLASAEANAQNIMALSGTFQNMFVDATTNGDTANAVFTIRVNGSAKATQVTVTASTTGIFSDTTNKTTVGATDLVCIGTAQATTSTTSGIISVGFMS